MRYEDRMKAQERSWERSVGIAIYTHREWRLVPESLRQKLQDMGRKFGRQISDEGENISLHKEEN